jgi:N utilization substance protein A
VSRKIKLEEKTPPVAKNEILQIADIVAKEKGIGIDDVISAMESAILKTAHMRYGEEKELSAVIDRKSGEIEIYRLLTIVDDVEDANKQILASDAKSIDPEAKVGDVLKSQLPSIEFGRISAQSARQVIFQKIGVAERAKQYEEFSGRVGEIITGIVKRIEYSNIIIDIGRTEGIIRKSETIPNEIFKVGDRIRVLLSGLNNEQTGPLLQLSRTHPNFVKKLFEQEVPEVYDGVVKIVAVARDPGSKAKIAVTTADPKLDPIGACVGIKGSRVQAVVDELKGEKIDVIQWSDNPAMFIVNSLAPAEVARIVIEKNENKVTVVVPDEQLSAAIGRRGQNVRLASKLTGWTISVTTEAKDAEARAQESERILNLFTTDLDVDDVVARMLMGEGYSSIEDIVNSSVLELSSIEGFDEIAGEIYQRAVSRVNERKKEIEELCKEKGVAKDLMEYELLRPALLKQLVNADMKTLNDVGDLSVDELLEIAGNLLSEKEAETLIMKIRKNWLDGDSK